MVLPCNVLISRALDTCRSTSVFLRDTSTIRQPSRRGAISRTIVSTSGSSGTLDLTPGDVAPPRLAFERNLVGGAATRARGDRHGRPQTGNAQHAASGRSQAP